MLIIDRYLLKQFLQTLVICFVSLTGLYIIFDSFTNLEEFLRCGQKSGGVLPLMASFYGYQSMVFFDRTSGLLNLIAAMFTVAWIQRHNELTALMAAGVSRWRVIKPVVVACVVISCLATVNREAVIPRFREELSRRPQDLIGDKAQQMRSRYDTSDILIGGKASFNDRKRIEAPCFMLPPTLGAYGNQLKAADAFYQPPHDGRPGGYLLLGVTEPRQIDARSSLSLDGTPIVLTRRDYAWLQPGECFVVSGTDFEQLTQAGGKAFRDFASTWQLIQALRSPTNDFGSDLRVAMHVRVVQPLLDITLLFLGLPLVLSRQSRNVFVAIGLCLGVVTIYVLSAVALQYLGTTYLIPPSLGAWASLIIFIPIAAAMSGALWE